MWQDGYERQVVVNTVNVAVVANGNTRFANLKTTTEWFKVTGKDFKTYLDKYSTLHCEFLAFLCQTACNTSETI